jgi:glucose uptake protein GlcU
MHKSLTPRTNLLVIFVWAAVVGVFVFAATHPNKALVIGVGAVLGLIAGIFQLRALRESKDRFRAATTSVEVRAAMTSTVSGRLATYTLYAAAVILILTAYTQKEAIGFAVFAGYAAFAFVRDSIALKGCLDLQCTAE